VLGVELRWLVLLREGGEGGEEEEDSSSYELGVKVPFLAEAVLV
jgi:hypothetical protein